jgi:hypothetical protein
VTFLLTNLPDTARVACFELDPIEGGGYYLTCVDVEGRKSYRSEFKNVLGGSYVARATVDRMATPQYDVTITKTGPD